MLSTSWSLQVHLHRRLAAAKWVTVWTGTTSMAGGLDLLRQVLPGYPSCQVNRKVGKQTHVRLTHNMAGALRSMLHSCLLGTGAWPWLTLL